MYTYIRTYVHTYIHAYINIYLYIRLYIHTHTSRCPSCDVILFLHKCSLTLSFSLSLCLCPSFFALCLFLSPSISLTAECLTYSHRGGFVWGFCKAGPCRRCFSNRCQDLCCRGLNNENRSRAYIMLIRSPPKPFPYSIIKAPILPFFGLPSPSRLPLQVSPSLGSRHRLCGCGT